MATQTTMTDIVPAIPAEVKKHADAYLTAKRAIAKHREKMNGSCEYLITAMHEAGLTEILIDDGEMRLTLEQLDKVKIKARKKSEENGDGE